jgi:hypothetical protein
MELLDLQTYDQSVKNREQDLGLRTSNTQTVGSNLHKEVILPFLVGVKCYGFYLYGTPLIYTQELDSDDNNSMDRSGYEMSDNSDFDLPRFGSLFQTTQADKLRR